MLKINGLQTINLKNYGEEITCYKESEYSEVHVRSKRKRCSVTSDATNTFSL